MTNHFYGEAEPADASTDVAIRANQPDPGGALATILASPEELKDYPIENLERLHALHVKATNEQARLDFIAAMLAIKREMTPVAKRGYNTHTHSRYALAEDVCRMLEPLMLKHNVAHSVTTKSGAAEGLTRFVLMLRHQSGHVEEHAMDAPIDNVGQGGKPTKTALHGMASSYTYCERHLLCKVFGILLVPDDDGNAAGAGPAGECISTAQAEELRGFMFETQTPEAKVAAHYNVSSIEELRVGDFRSAMLLLERKVARQRP